MQSSSRREKYSAANIEYCRRAQETRPIHTTPAYFEGSATRCDLCSTTFEARDYFADAELPGLGQWCYFCQECLMRHRVRFGKGRGHLYLKVTGEPVPWQCVAGHPG